MKIPTPSVTFATLTFAIASLLALPAVNAVTIGFETEDGYSLGHVAGQPATGSKWDVQVSGHANLNVTANAGTSGNDNALVASKTETGAAGFYSLPFSSSDLGGTFDPDLSLVAFSFDFRYLDLGQGSVTGGIAIIRMGHSINGEVFTLSFFNNGTISYSGGAPNSYAKNGTGGAFVATENYFNISGVIDYAANRFMLEVNGVGQTGTDGANPTWLNFQKTTTGAVGFHVLSANVTTNGWRPYAIDNLSVDAIPEPSTIALLGLSLAGGGWYRSRNRV